MEHVLITGGTGVTGNALVRCALLRNIRVTALVRPGSPRKRFLPRDNPRLRVVDCGMEDYRRVGARLPAGAYDAFFHLSWDGSRGKRKADNRDSFQLQTRNISYALDAVELCHELRCPVFVMTGSQAEYGRKGHAISEDEEKRPENGYGMAKLCAEGMTRLQCRRYGIRHIWPILFSVYGPNDGTESLVDTSVRGLLRGETLPYTAGEQQWDYLYSLDAAQALLSLAESGEDGEPYHVASGRTRPLKEFILELYRELAPDRLPRLGELPYAEGQVMYLGADIRKLQDATGFAPKYGFREGIREVADAVRRESELEKEEG